MIYDCKIWHLRSTTLPVSWKNDKRQTQQCLFPTILFSCWEPNYLTADTDADLTCQPCFFISSFFLRNIFHSFVCGFFLRQVYGLNGKQIWWWPALPSHLGYNPYTNQNNQNFSCWLMRHTKESLGEGKTDSVMWRPPMDSWVLPDTAAVEKYHKPYL